MLKLAGSANTVPLTSGVSPASAAAAAGVLGALSTVAVAVVVVAVVGVVICSEWSGVESGGRKDSKLAVSVVFYFVSFPPLQM